MKRNLLLATALLALVASCSQDDGRSASGANERAPLCVSSVTTLSGESNTRATTPVPVPVPVTSGTLAVGFRDGNGYVKRNDLEYTYVSGAWSTTVNSLLPYLSKDPASLWAYHPMGGEHVHTITEVPLVQQAYDAANDLSYASTGGANVCAAHPYARFVLKHQYARVKINIAFSPLFDAGQVFNKLSLVSDNAFLSKGTLDVATGVFAAGSVVSPGIVRTADTRMDALPEGRKYLVDELMIPLPADALTGKNPTLTITVDGSDWKVPITGLTTLESGKMYRIKVKMGAEVVVESVTVEEWTAGGEFNGGDTTYE